MRTGSNQKRYPIYFSSYRREVYPLTILVVLLKLISVEGKSVHLIIYDAAHN